eukprot:EG_transcript_11531
MSAKGDRADGQRPDIATFKRVRLARVLALTWLAYAAFLVARKPTSVARVELQDKLGISTHAIGLIDTAFLTTYCVGQIFYGTIDQYVSASGIISKGLLGSALCVALCATSSSVPFLMVVWGLNGLLQSFGWPSCIKVLTPWVGSAERGRVMGVWSTCQSVGGVAANAIIAFFLQHAGWRAAFFCCAVMASAVGVANAALLVDHPKQLEWSLPEELQNGSAVHGSTPTTAEGDAEEMHQPSGDHDRQCKAETRLSTRGALMVPGVFGLSVSYFCQKVVRYALLFWLPFYISKVLQYSVVAAGYMSAAFDLGGVVGTFASGIMSDMYQKGRRRITIVCLFLVLSTAFLAAFSWGEAAMRASTALTCLLCFAVGFVLFGCDSLLTGPVIQDIAERAGLPSQAGTLSGVVGGLGSLGAILQGGLTSTVSEAYGWPALFHCLVGLSAVSIACMWPALRIELE